MTPRVLGVVLALLMLGPVASAVFLDPIAQTPSSVMAVAADDGKAMAGMRLGHVVATDLTAESNVWSTRPAAQPVRALAVHDGLLAVIHQDQARIWALETSDGSIAWERDLAGLPVDVSPTSQGFLVAIAGGTLRELDSTGALVAEGTLPGSPLAVHVAGDRAAAVGSTGTWALRSDAGSWSVTASSTTGGTDVWLADAIYTASGNRALRMEAADSALVTTASFEAGGPIGAVTYVDGSVVAGDADSFVHVLDDGLGLQHSIATHAQQVLDLKPLGQQALVAFSSGWMGWIPLDARPSVLILDPQEFFAVPTLTRVEWAASDPDAGAGETLTFAVQVRRAGATPGPWQTLSTGTMPASPFIVRHHVDVDLSGFPGGAHLEIKVTATDRDGRSGEDRLSASFLVDHDPPVAVGSPAPREGQVVHRAQPVIGVGHRDLHAGIVPERTEVLIDGSPDHMTVTRERTFTQAEPTRDLADGEHTWSVRVEDRAGNTLTQEGTFIVDAEAPRILATAMEGEAANHLLYRVEVSEPAECTVRLGPGDHVVSSPQDIVHRVFVAGLEPYTEYTGTVRCTDPFGKHSTAALPSASTLPGSPGAPQPTMTIATTPLGPDGHDGWYLSEVSLHADVSPSGDVLWSLDGGPFSSDAPTLTGGGTHVVRAFATSEEGVASSAETLTLKVDTTPPVVDELTWLPGPRVLAWSQVTDPESGVTELRVEGLTGGWSVLTTLEPSSRRSTDIPDGVTALRLVAVNGAGGTLEKEVDGFSPDTDAAQGTIVSVVKSPLAPDETVRLRFRLAHGELWQTALLTDANGIEHPFTGRRQVSDGAFEATAPAAAFGPGVYEGAIRVHTGASVETLPAGQVEILEPDGKDDDRKPNATGIAERDSPGAPVLLALAVLGGMVAWRRRSGGRC